MQSSRDTHTHTHIVVQDFERVVHLKATVAILCEQITEPEECVRPQCCKKKKGFFFLTYKKHPENFKDTLS